MATPRGALTKVPTGELGVSGTTNWHGQLQTEPALKLQHAAAYGTPGMRGWGYWERLRRTDAAVAEAIGFHLGPIRDAVVGVQPATGVEHAQAHADFVRWVLTERMSPGWAAFATETVTGALGTGFAVHEDCWGDVEHPALPGGKGSGIVKFAQRLPSSFDANCWIEDPTTGELKTVVQQGTHANSWRRVELPASKLFLLSWDREGNNYAGYSLFRPVCFLAEVRAEIVKLPGVTLMREGAGIPVVMADKDAPDLTEEQAEALDDLLSKMVAHENAYARMPAGYKIEWLFSGASNKNHIVEIYNSFGTAILSIAHAQQLSLGIGETGSRSVGEVHERKSQEMTHAICANFEAALNGRAERSYEGPIRKMIDANWGPQPAYPKISLTLKRQSMEPTKKIAATTQAVASGLLTPTLEIENALREDLGFSPIDAATRDAHLARRALELSSAQAPAPRPGTAP